MGLCRRWKHGLSEAPYWRWYVHIKEQLHLHSSMCVFHWLAKHKHKLTLVSLWSTIQVWSKTTEPWIQEFPLKELLLVSPVVAIHTFHVVVRTLLHLKGFHLLMHSYREKMSAWQKLKELCWKWLYYITFACFNQRRKPSAMFLCAPFFSTEWSSFKHYTYTSTTGEEEAVATTAQPVEGRGSDTTSRVRELQPCLRSWINIILWHFRRWLRR